ncbi:MAG: hypothetical protein RLY16_2496 [Bacteroidota bacterium]|jgi:hypothetical protein
MLKKLGWVLLILVVAIQFFRPEKNIHPETSAVAKDISTLYPVPDKVKDILKTSCNDCHSNNTAYPWYSNFQPVAWWLNDHVQEGKRELNFNEFAGYRLRKQYHKLEEIVEQVKEGEMPLKSYTLVHGNAKLTEDQKYTLTAWSEALLDSMRAHYPIDSLQKKK